MIHIKKIVTVSVFLSINLVLFGKINKDKIDSLEQVLASFSTDNLEKYRTLISLAKTYQVDLELEKSKECLLEALNIAQKKGWELEEAEVYKQLGNNYYLTGQYYLCQANYKKSEIIFQKHDYDNVISIFKNYMILFYEIGDYKSSIYYNERVLEWAIQKKDTTEQLVSLYFKGLINYPEYDSQECLDFYSELYKKTSQFKNRQSNHIAQHYAEILLTHNRMREALSIFFEGIEYYLTEKHYLPFQTYSLIAIAYAKLNQLDSAEYFLQKVIEAPKIDNTTKEFLHYAQYLIERNKGNYKSAYEKFKQFHKISNSILVSQKTTDVSRLKNWQEIEQKEREKELLQTGKENRQKLIWFLMGALIIILALFAIALYLFRKTTEKNRELHNLNTVKDKLFSVMSHDIRSPLSSLLSTLKLAKTNLLDNETQTLILDDISKQVDGTNDLIENLLCWSTNQMKGINFVPINFDVKEKTESVINSLNHIAIAKNVNIINNIKSEQIFADPDMFSIIVRNITMNAIKYSSTQQEILLNSEKSENSLIISVKDSGTGMSQEVQDKLFKLTTTQSQPGTNNEKGTGLGLVLCYDFVKINDGKIWFESKVGEGSTFYTQWKMVNG